jgi:hypothetical protein
MTDQRHRGTEPSSQVPSRIPEPRGATTTRVREWDDGLERLPRRAERFLSLLDRSRRA